MNRIRLDKFLQTFNSISYVKNEGEETFVPYLQAFFEDYGGMVIFDGWYRIHTKASAIKWYDLVSKIFSYPGHVIPIGFDWMGRQFAMDLIDGNMVAFCVEFWDYETYFFNLEQFHNEYLVENGEEVLGKHAFEAWQKAEGGFDFDECLACKVSLIEGGENVWENLGREKMWGYWERNLALRIEEQNRSVGEMAPVESSRTVM